MCQFQLKLVNLLNSNLISIITYRYFIYRELIFNWIVRTGINPYCNAIDVSRAKPSRGDLPISELIRLSRKRKRALIDECYWNRSTGPTMLACFIPSTRHTFSAVNNILLFILYETLFSYTSCIITALLILIQSYRCLMLSVLLNSFSQHYCHNISRFVLIFAV